MYSIYKIQKGDLCYIGITNDFKRRIKDHRSVCLNQEKKGHDYKLYQAIRVDGWDAWTKEVVETTDDRTRERYWFELMGNLNKNIPTKSRRERTTEKNTCECGGKFVRGSRARHFKTVKHLTYIDKKNV